MVMQSAMHTLPYTQPTVCICILFNSNAALCMPIHSLLLAMLLEETCKVPCYEAVKSSVQHLGSQVY